jgi:hypothetical protein
MKLLHRKLAFLPILVLALSGCAALKPQDFTRPASSTEKDARIDCVSYDSFTVDVGLLSMEVDAGVVTNGELEVKCGQNSVKFTNKRGLR